jgi:hypothetical protein
VISRRSTAALFIFILFLSPTLLAVDGAFQGRVVDPPSGAKLTPGWIFIQGHNKTLRRVEVNHARVVMSEEASAHQPCQGGIDCLTVGTEVRITASQGSDGEWHARVVEVLKFAKGSSEISPKLEFSQRQELRKVKHAPDARDNQ